MEIKANKSNVADLKRPFKTRVHFDSEACGAIELAYLRGYQAGMEDAHKKTALKARQNP